MIISQIANITQQQLDFSYFVRASKEDRLINEFEGNMLQACYFTSSTTFNLAHWFLLLVTWSYLTKLKSLKRNYQRKLSAAD